MTNTDTKLLGRVRSRVSVLLSILAVLAGFAVEAPGDGYAGDVHGLGCSFTGSTGTMLITGRGDGRIEVIEGGIALFERPPDSYSFNWGVACENSQPPYEQATPTIFNTDTVIVRSVGEFGSEAGLQPGLSAESGAPEIELIVADSVTALGVDAGESATEVVLGATPGGSGVNLNAADEPDAESDVDVVFEGDPPPPLSRAFPNVSVYTEYGSPTPRTFTAAGGAGFSGPFPTGVALSSGAGDDVLVAGLGKSNLDPGVGSDVVRGGPAGDALRACGDRAEAYGGGGNDRIGFGILTAVVSGGQGSNWAQFYCRPGAPLRLDLAVSRPQGLGQGAALTMLDISNLEASEFDDVLRGNAEGNTIFGLAGPDRINGAGGDDELLANQGPDHLVGGPGADWLDGSFGIDTLIARDGSRDLRIDCRAGTDALERAVVDRTDPDALSC